MLRERNSDVASFVVYSVQSIFPAGNYMFKVSNKNTRTRCENMFKVNNKDTWRRSGVFIVNFEHISHLALVFLLFTFNM